MPSIEREQPPLLARAPRPVGMRLIIAYKVVKAPVMLGIALWLTLAPARALGLAVVLVGTMHEHGGLWFRVARWIAPHLTHHVLAAARMLAWLDGAFTCAEAALLWRGKPWGEWLVVSGLALLLPFEAQALAVHHRLDRAVVLALNVLIVGYLARRRVVAARARGRAASR